MEYGHGSYIPGKRDINNHFQAGAPIRRTRKIYDRISNNKDYKFGELTSLFMRYDEIQDDAWQNEINGNYRRNTLMRSRDTLLQSCPGYIDGSHPQVSLTFEWVDGPAKVTMTQAGDAYTITISGLRAPPRLIGKTRNRISCALRRATVALGPQTVPWFSIRGMAFKGVTHCGVRSGGVWHPA